MCVSLRFSKELHQFWGVTVSSNWIQLVWKKADWNCVRITAHAGQVCSLRCVLTCKIYSYSSGHMVLLWHWLTFVSNSIKVCVCTTKRPPSFAKLFVQFKGIRCKRNRFESSGTHCTDLHLHRSVWCFGAGVQSNTIYHNNEAKGLAVPVYHFSMGHQVSWGKMLFQFCFLKDDKCL